MSAGKENMKLFQVAYHHIRQAMCRGEIAPGDILSESQLAARMKMSRTPVREALRALDSEGRLEIRNGIGAYVKPLSTKDMEDLYEVRALLEGQAARTAVHHISQEEIASLETRFTRLLQPGYAPGEGEFSRLDWELHELIVERCENECIKSVMRSNMDKMKCYQRLSARVFNDIPESTRQHLTILELLRRRDGEALARALQEHLNWAASFLKNA